MKPGGPKGQEALASIHRFLPEAGRVDVESVMPNPGVYTKEELAALHSQVLSNLEQAWELLGGSEDQLLSTMMQISQVVAQQFRENPS